MARAAVSWIAVGIHTALPDAHHALAAVADSSDTILVVLAVPRRRPAALGVALRERARVRTHRAVGAAIEARRPAVEQLDGRRCTAAERSAGDRPDNKVYSDATRVGPHGASPTCAAALAWGELG